MGSLRFDGVLFVAYPQDHEPRHVHGFYAETEAIVELRGAPVRGVTLAQRRRTAGTRQTERCEAHLGSGYRAL